MVKKLSPAQQQYMDLKQEYKDALLFFRLGDFYELFYEDAKIAHKELDITLTARNKKSENPIPMAGVPYHAAEKYIKKLIGAGYKVAIAEQIGQMVPGRVIDRQVVRVVTPGTEIKDDYEFNHIAALYYSEKGERRYHMSRGDISLGSFFTQSFSTIEVFLKALFRLSPQEIVVDINFPERDDLEQYIHQVLSRVISFDDVPYDTVHYLQKVTKTLSLDGYGQALQKGRESALALLFSYSEKMQKKPLSIVHTIQYKAPEKYITFDEITLRNLEVFQSRSNFSSKESLYGVINTCQTAMGSRVLYERLSHPIHDLKILSKRLSLIEYYVLEKEKRVLLVNLLKNVSDLPRLMSKILYRKPQATKVQQLMLSLDHLLGGEYHEFLGVALEKHALERKDISVLYNILGYLQLIIQSDQIQDDMGYIVDGYDKDVDNYRQIAYHSDDLLLHYQTTVVEHTGGIRVKIKYVKNQGYCLEITPRDIEKFEATVLEGDEKFGFIRRQTLKTGQRYTTSYLSELEGSILDAKEFLRKREMEMLLGCVEYLNENSGILFNFFDAIGQLDLSLNFANFSEIHNRTKPVLGKDFKIQIEQGRHPVVEEFLEKTQQFIPNDCLLDESNFFHLITGPNMGGKSTFLRQNALIVLLAHTGLYVPASKAIISLVDGIFARVGSGDALAKNQSTFMTEMLEMANILHNATSKSFIVLDELGRGTSTYDGLSLAKSISVYMCQELKAKTLFATHYHELTELSDVLGVFENFSMSVYETENEVVFLKKVVKGKASKSYGIDVAKLAGIPSPILEKAEIYLRNLEKLNTGKTAKPLQQGLAFGVVDDKWKIKYKEIEKALNMLSIDNMTPIEALLYLQKLKQKI